MAFADFFSNMFGSSQPQLNEETKLALIAQKSPGLGQFLMNNMKLQKQQDDYNKMSKFADFIYGQPGAQGAPGTGVYDTTAGDEVRLQEMSKRMLQTGLAPFIKQWGLNQNDMQKAIMDANRLNDKDPTSYREYLLTLADGQAPTGPGFDAFLKNRKAGININMGDKAVKFSEIPNLVDAEGNNPMPGVTYEELGGKYKYRPPVSTDQAGRQSMLEVSLVRMPAIRKQLYSGPNNTIDRKALFQMGVLDKTRDIPGVNLATAWWASDKAKSLQNDFETGIQAIVRTETGAAMAPSEIGNTARRFMPSPTDSDQLIEAKLKGYEQFITTALNLLRPNSNGTSSLPPDTARRLIDSAANEALSNATKFDQMTDQKSRDRTQIDGIPVILD